MVTIELINVHIDGTDLEVDGATIYEYQTGYFREWAVEISSAKSSNLSTDLVKFEGRGKDGKKYSGEGILTLLRFNSDGTWDVTLKGSGPLYGID